MDDGGEDFDVARFVVRVRRLADLSQRDLAAHLGVSPSSVSDIESGRRRVGVQQLTAILGLADLRLCVVDAEGVEVRPVSPRVVRDNAGRRFPAHLDVTHPDELPPERLLSPRYDRQPAQAWYHLREARDRLREDAGADQPMDHLTPDAIRWRRRERIAELRRAARARAAARHAASGIDEYECSCETECWCGTACIPACGCQCEPA